MQKTLNQFEVIDESTYSFKDIIHRIIEVMPKMKTVNTKMNLVTEEKNNIAVSIEKSKSYLKKLLTQLKEYDFTAELNQIANEVAEVGNKLSLNTKERGIEINKFRIK